MGQSRIGHWCRGLAGALGQSWGESTHLVDAQQGQLRPQPTVAPPRYALDQPPLDGGQHSSDGRQHIWEGGSHPALSGGLHCPCPQHTGLCLLSLPGPLPESCPRKTLRADGLGAAFPLRSFPPGRGEMAVASSCQPCPPPRGALGPSGFPSALTDSARVRTLINQCQARHRQQGRHSSAALQPHTSHCPGPIQMARKQPMQHIKEMRQK